MPTLLVPSLQSSLPTRPVGINLSDPITRGLVFAAYVVGDRFYDAVSRTTSVKVGTLRPMASIDGNRAPAMHGKGVVAVGGGFLEATAADRINGPLSVFVEGNHPTNGTTAALFKSHDATTKDGFGLHWDDGINFTTNCFFYYRNNSNGSASNADALGANSELYAHRMAITADGTNVNFYAKGKLDRTVADAVLPNANSARRVTIAGVNNSQSTQSVSVALVFNRVISLAEYQRLYACPAIVFEPDMMPLFWSSNPPQIVYPNGDVAGGAWLPSTGTDLYACIDETSASDTDYIYTTVPGAYQEFTFPNCGAVDPSTGGHVRYRIPAGTGTITAILKQGSTTLQTLGTHTLTGSAQDIDITIAASVANSDNLRVGFTASA